jgi:hypothetical protein
LELREEEDHVMTAVELIAAALAAGASAGITKTAGDAISDAYAAFKGLLSFRLADSAHGIAALEAEETEAGVWQTNLGEDLISSGATEDEGLLAAAARVLALLGPQGSHVAKYNVATNYGAVGTFNAPVSFTVPPPVPPAPPEVI